MPPLRVKRLLLAALAGVLCAFPLSAQIIVPRQDFSEKDVPAPLKPWTAWTLADSRLNPCPHAHHDFVQRQCIWPGKLTLQLNEKAGSFSFSVVSFDRGWIPLPGDAERWPLDVKIGQAAGVVIPYQGKPALWLEPGQHLVTGAFRWDALPEMLSIPPSAALIALSVEGDTVAFPDLERQTMLWLRRPRAQTQAPEALDVKIFRRMTDSIPMSVETSMRLHVSGLPRETTLSKVQLPETVPMQIASELPARLEPDGTLRLQLRPGTWQLRLRSRFEGPRNDITLPEGMQEEVWVFEAQNHLRLVQVEGLTPLDPAQTELPPDWRGFPAYLARPGETLRLSERKRGDSEPAPDELRLQREWWLDFDGAGFSIRDRMQGQIRRSWRLEAQPEAKLGRVAIHGRDQFITRLREDGHAGVEIRPGALNLEADSRVEKAAFTLHATGWNHDIDHLSATLHLPPGWSLFSAQGVDAVSQSWLQRWTLLDIFLVLLATIALYRLFDRLTAALGGIGLVLLHPEFPVVTGAGLVILACIALLRRLPAGRFATILRQLRRVTLLLLLLSAVPFMLQHLRSAMYPQLQYFAVDADSHYQTTPAVGAPMPAAAGQIREQAQSLRHKGEKDERRAEAMERAAKALEKRAMEPADSIGNVAPEAAGGMGNMLQQEIYQYDPSQVAHTGYGVSNWRSASVGLQWNGPVDPSQAVRLWLISPGINLLLAFLRVLFLMLLIAFLFGLPARRLRNPAPVSQLFAVAFLFLAPSLAMAQVPADTREFPPQTLLDQLRQRYLSAYQKPPECLPECASVARTRLDITPGQLVLHQEIHAAGELFLPLPGHIQAWRPQAVVIDGQADLPLRMGEDGYLQAKLSAGVHHVQLIGALPAGNDAVTLRLPLPSHYTEASAAGWEVQGIHENGKSDAQLQFLRLAKPNAQTENQEKLEETNQAAIPSFFRVERIVSFGASWQVETVLRRLTSPEAPAMAAIPLLPGEAVTTPEIPVKDGKVLVNLAPQEMEKRWQSHLAPMEALTLHAPESVNWAEIWHLNISNLWHVTWEGLPPVQLPGAPIVYSNAGQPVQMPSFHPWPGETLTLHVARPMGVAGPTLTIDQSRLELRLGQRSLDAGLNLHMRSNQGGQHVITLPAEAKLGEVTLNGSPTPVHHKENQVTLPVAPGNQQVTLKWTQPVNPSLWFTTPPVHLGAPSVNADVSLSLPQDRWILFAHGPSMGPAVLIWSWIILILLFSFALGKLTLTPLRMHHWFLLLLGLTQANIFINLAIVGWLLALGWRCRTNASTAAWAFNLRQLGLAAWTVISLLCLFVSIKHGLLGSPDMKIAGYGSSSYLLRWYQDIAGEVLPQTMALSLPMLVYRGLMLAWALWLALSLTRWLSWGWQCFSLGGYWKRRERKQPPAAT